MWIEKLTGDLAACGGFLIARWDRTTHCADLRQAREFLQRVGGGR